MARFQVFIPKSEQVPLENLLPQQPLEAVGLADLITNAAGQESIGPEDQHGILVSWPTTGDADTGYKPEVQTWVPAVPSEGLAAKRYWVGIWNDKKPTPQNLKRPYPYPGVHVALNDGNEWTVPIAKELPNELKLADDGSVKFVVQRQYHDVWAEAFAWADKFGKEGPDGEFEWGDLYQYILKVYKLNYMITGELVSELGLFSQSNLLESLLVVCGGVSGGK